MPVLLRASTVGHVLRVCPFHECRSEGHVDAGLALARVYHSFRDEISALGCDCIDACALHPNDVRGRVSKGRSTSIHGVCFRGAFAEDCDKRTSENLRWRVVPCSFTTCFSII